MFYDLLAPKYIQHRQAYNYYCFVFRHMQLKTTGSEPIFDEYRLWRFETEQEVCLGSINYYQTVKPGSAMCISHLRLLQKLKQVLFSSQSPPDSECIYENVQSITLPALF